MSIRRTNAEVVEASKRVWERLGGPVYVFTRHSSLIVADSSDMSHMEKMKKRPLPAYPQNAYIIGKVLQQWPIVNTYDPELETLYVIVDPQSVDHILDRPPNMAWLMRHYMEYII